MDAKSLLLTAAFRHTISEPNIEAGLQRIRAITCCGDDDTFRDAVADCLREGLIHEPIRLPEGALQCHWHLELTPKGVEAARAIGSCDVTDAPLASSHGLVPASTTDCAGGRDVPARPSSGMAMDVKARS